jgi:hypothetical protein
MEKQKISITRALSEIKLLDSKITKAISNTKFISAFEGQRDVDNTGVKIVDFNERVKSNYQSIKDLIERRKTIKQKITISNATTKVKIAEVEYFVCEAIERKSSIQHERDLLNKLKKDYTNLKNQVDTANVNMRAKIEQNVNAMAGSEKDKSSLVQEFIKKSIESSEWKLVDPLKIEDEIIKLETEIDEFVANVDFELSTSNALTTIEV